MALSTLGTATTTALPALAFSPANVPADIASIALAIKNDQDVTHPIWPGAFSRMGLLYIPNRGVLQVLPGDYVAVDSQTGWPILVSSRAAASNPAWVHTP